MSVYHKIQTLFLRDPDTNHRTLLVGQFAKPEFAYLWACEWAFTEKVDGTNIRVHIDIDRFATFSGKTDNAQMPPKLMRRLAELFTQETVLRAFPRDDDDGSYPEITLYGEGYGASIQKGGGNYKPDGVDFVLFDVRIGTWWLKREDVHDIARNLDIECVPVIGTGPLCDMVSLAVDGFESRWGMFAAEGVVARPTEELFDRRGDRIITKLKAKDFA